MSLNGEAAQLLPLDGHLTFHSRDSLSPLQSPHCLFPSLPSPPSIRYIVCLHAQRVNPNPFTQLYPSHIGVLDNQTLLWPPFLLHQAKKECCFLSLSLSISDCSSTQNCAVEWRRTTVSKPPVTQEKNFPPSQSALDLSSVRLFYLANLAPDCY